MNRTTLIALEARETLSDHMTTAVEVVATTADGKRGTATYAPGVCYGPHYGADLFDGDDRHNGRGMLTAAEHINRVIGPALVGMDSLCQSAIDQTILASMDAANVPRAVNISSPVSFAVLKAAAATVGVPLHQYVGGAFAAKIPVPGFLCANGSGRYGEILQAHGRPSYAFVAYDFATHGEADYALWEVESKWEKLAPKEYGVRIHHTSSRTIPKGRVADDGALMDMLARAIKEAGFENRVGLHIDFAATAYYDPALKMYSGLYDAKARTREEMIQLVTDMTKHYPLVIVQDPLEANDMDGFTAITQATDVQVAGADLIGTDSARLEQCAANGCCNAAVLRVHKYPTFSACAHAVALCEQYALGVMPVDSAGEDSDIVQYALGFRAGSIGMSGLSSHGNLMSFLESEIGPRASFFGRYGLKGTRFALA